jgi:predicted nucleic acid-binding protein
MHLKTVAATVRDIRQVEPSPEDEFLVDTNAWYWVTYSRASTLAVDQQAKYQKQHYSGFIKKALERGAILHRCELSLAELCHTIEDCERRIFAEYVGCREVPAKEHRHCEDEERDEVVSEIESAWGQVVQMSQCLELAANSATSADVLKDLRRCRVDGYDLFILQAMKKGGITRIVTDDSDFATVAELEVFTCNRGLIDLAGQQGRLRD